MSDLDKLLTSLCEEYTAGHPDLERCVSSLKRKLNCDDVIPTNKKKQKVECALCKKTFFSVANMRRHTTLHCKMRNIVYPCKHCDARFNNYSAVFDHINKSIHQIKQVVGKLVRHGVKVHSRERHESITFFLKKKKNMT